MEVGSRYYRMMKCRPLPLLKQLLRATFFSSAFALPLLLCQCGDGGEEPSRPDKKQAVFDPVAAVKSTVIPEVDLESLDISPSMLSLGKTNFKAAKGKGWGELIGGLSDTPPKWTVEGSPDAGKPERHGVRVNFAVEGDMGSVLFDVSKDGTMVGPVEFGEDGDIDSTVPDQITFMIVYGWGDKTGVGREGLLDPMKVTAARNKNLAILKGCTAAARIWALEHRAFPETFSGLATEAFGDSFDGFVDPGSRKEHLNAIYFSDVTVDSEGSLIHMACPFINPDGTRTIVYADGAAEHIKEADYQEQAAKQTIAPE